MSDQPPPISTFGALILAGGRSSRMGTDKASLPYRGVTLIQHMRGLLSQAGAWPILIGGGARWDLRDPIAEGGPVGGLCALGRHAGAAGVRWAVLPVDMPLLGTKLLHRLVGAPGAVFFESHPLPFAVTMDRTARAVLEEAEARLRAGERVAVHEVLASLGAEALTPDALEAAQLVNANTPEEWASITREDP